MTVERELTIIEVARELSVSVAFADDLLARGVIPSRLSGGRLRLALLSDVRAYGDRIKREQSAACEVALEEIHDA